MTTTTYNRPSSNASNASDSLTSVDSLAHIEHVRTQLHRKGKETKGDFPSCAVEETAVDVLGYTAEFMLRLIPGTIYRYAEMLSNKKAYDAAFTHSTQRVEGGFVRSRQTFEEMQAMIKDSLKELGHTVYNWRIHTHAVTAGGMALFDQDRVPVTHLHLILHVPVLETGTATPWVINDATVQLSQDLTATDSDFSKMNDIFAPNEDI